MFKNLKQFESPIELMEIGHRTGVMSNCDKTSSQSSVDAIVAGLQTAELLKLLILLEE